jgi:hypothetical protein
MTSASTENNACRYVAALLSLKQISAAERALNALAAVATLSPENLARYRSLIDAAKSSSNFQ